MLAAVAIAACNTKGLDLENAPKTVEIIIENSNVTKAGITSPVTNGAYVCDPKDLTALFADASGNIVKSVSFDGLTADGNKYTFTEVPASVAQVAVIAYRGYTAQTTLEGARELWLTTESVVAEANNTIVYGEDLKPTTTKTDDGYVLKASVEVTTSLARIEVSSISCTNLGTYSAIALHNMSLTSYEYYAEQLNTTLASTSDKATAGTDKVWSWNIKEQEVMNIVLDMNVTGNGHTVAIPEKKLTVNSYKYNGSPITTFEAGNVYNFAINFAASNLDSDASATVSAEVTVTISNWVVNTCEVGFATGN